MDEKNLAKTSASQRDPRLKELGLRIRECRKKKAWTQETLAYQIGSTEGKAYVSRIELGKVNISIVVLCRIADALDVKVSDLTIDF